MVGEGTKPGGGATSLFSITLIAITISRQMLVLLVIVVLK